jgi:hypothetical protein
MLAQLLAPAAAAATDLTLLMTDSRVPGVSMAVIRNGKAPVPIQLGVRNATTAAALDDHTVFASASLSKPLFAYVVMQLMDAGVLFRRGGRSSVCAHSRKSTDWRRSASAMVTRVPTSVPC